MSSVFRDATQEETAKTFEFELISAEYFGFDCSFGTRLSSDVVDAINAVAAKWPANSSAEVETARAVFSASQSKGGR